MRTRDPGRGPTFGKTRQIASLLALAMDQDGTPEGDTARKTAEDLISRYGVGEPGELPGTVIFRVPAAFWRRLVWTAVAEYADCRFTFRLGSGCLWGFSRDIEISQYLYDLIIVQMEQATKRRRALAPITRRGLTSYRLSYAYGVSAKLGRLKGRGELSDRKAARVDDYVEQETTGTEGTRRPATRVTEEGFIAGREVEIRNGIAGRPGVVGYLQAGE